MRVIKSFKNQLRNIIFVNINSYFIVYLMTLFLKHKLCYYKILIYKLQQLLIHKLLCAKYCTTNVFITRRSEFE